MQILVRTLRGAERKIPSLEFIRYERSTAGKITSRMKERERERGGGGRGEANSYFELINLKIQFATNNRID